MGAIRAPGHALLRLDTHSVAVSSAQTTRRQFRRAQLCGSYLAITVGFLWSVTCVVRTELASVTSCHVDRGNWFSPWIATSVTTMHKSTVTRLHGFGSWFTIVYWKWQVTVLWKRTTVVAVVLFLLVWEHSLFKQPLECQVINFFKVWKFSWSILRL